MHTKDNSDEPNLSSTRVIRITMLLFGLDLFSGQHWRFDLGTFVKLLALLCSTVLLCMGCTALIVHLIFTVPLLTSTLDVPLTYKAIYVWFFQTCSQAIEVSYYGLAYIRKQKLHRFLEELDETIRDVSSPQMAVKWDRRIKVVIIGTNLLLLLAGWQFIIQATYGYDQSSLTFMGISQFDERLYTVFVVFRYVTTCIFLPFMIFCEVLYTVVCCAAASLCDNLKLQTPATVSINPSPRLSIVWIPEVKSSKQAFFPLWKLVKDHKSVGNLVCDFDGIFAEHMLLTSAVTTGIFLFSIKAFLTNQVDTREYIIAATFTMFFVLKACVGSMLNEKIEISMKMRSYVIAKDKQQQNSIKDNQDEAVTEDHKHYMLYLTECTITHAVVTYGGFMPVKKSIILTVAGIVTTYYFILADHISK